MSCAKALRTIGLKLESTAYSGESLDQYDYNVSAQNIEYTPEIEATVANRLYGDLSKHGVVSGKRSIDISFYVDMAWSGIVDVAPTWGKLLKACGFLETVYPAMGIEYTPDSDSAATPLTIEVVEQFSSNQIVIKATGCMGNVSFVCEDIGEPVQMRFEFKGVLDSITDRFLKLEPTDFDTEDPDTLLGAGVTLNTLQHEQVLVLENASWNGRAFAAVALDDNDYIYLTGGYKGGASVREDDCWRSADGINWTKMSENNLWGDRDNHGSIYHSSALWIAGGFVTGSGTVNDIWKSVDNGATWSNEGAAAWTTRSTFQLIEFNDEVYLIFGSYYSGGSFYTRNDIWKTSDMASWSSVTGTLPTPRYDYTACVHSGKLYIMGGYDSTSLYNDVWYTQDGSTWVQAINEAPWTARRGLLSWTDGTYIYVFGGDNGESFPSLRANEKDLWRSTDGKRWEEVILNNGAEIAYINIVTIGTQNYIVSGRFGSEIYGNDVYEISPKPQESTLKINKFELNMQNDVQNYSAPDRVQGLDGARVVSRQPAIFVDGDMDLEGTTSYFDRHIGNNTLAFDMNVGDYLKFKANKVQLIESYKPGDREGHVVNNITFLLTKDTNGDDELSVIHGEVGLIYPASLISYWKLDEASAASAASDEIGTENGTYINSPTMRQSGAPGSDYSVLFNGSNQYVSIPQNDAHEGMDILFIDVWVYPDSTGSGFRHPIVSKWGKFGSTDDYYNLEIWNDDQILWQINTVDHTQLAFFTGMCVNNDQWNHIQALYDSTQDVMKVWRDGEEKVRNLTIHTWNEINHDDASEPLRIGDQAGAAGFFKGRIDEVKIYNENMLAT